VKASQDVTAIKAARRLVVADALEVVQVTAKAVKEAEAAREALRAARASEELARTELNSLWFEAARVCDSVLGAASSGMPLTT
jgi:hypothetical protein